MDTKRYQQLATDGGIQSLYLQVLRDILPRPIPREAWSQEHTRALNMVRVDEEPGWLPAETLTPVS
jgi:hypothetical protein